MCATGISFDLHPQNLTGVAKNEGGWKMCFLFKWVNFKVHVTFRVCIYRGHGAMISTSIFTQPQVFFKSIFLKGAFFQGQKFHTQLRGCFQK